MTLAEVRKPTRLTSNVSLRPQKSVSTLIICLPLGFMVCPMFSFPKEVLGRVQIYGMPLVLFPDAYICSSDEKDPCRSINVHKLAIPSIGIVSLGTPSGECRVSESD